ncbi:MAG: recombinase family protein, partial [Candidatus Limnocylindrales bacterium]
MERYPVAYIRRSYADANSTGDVSREVQESAIRELAHRDGHNGDVEVFVDWGKSASEAKSASRSKYAAMLAAVEDGKVSTVYA